MTTLQAAFLACQSLVTITSRRAACYVTTPSLTSATATLATDVGTAFSAVFIIGIAFVSFGASTKASLPRFLFITKNRAL